MNMRRRDERQSRTRRAANQRDESRTEAQRCRGAKAQMCRGAKAKTGRVPCERRKKKNTSRNAGEKRSYIGSARARGARGDRSHAHTNRDAHLACV